jgi:ABC-type polar amino acid transport system ATPase subunit
MTTESPPAGIGIGVNGLAKHFGTRKVLNGVSLDIPAGTTMALIGPSGGGKSTLLRCLAGLETFQDGSVSFGDKTLVSGTNHGALTWLRSRVGMIFQDYQLFPHMTALANVTAAPRWVTGLGAAEARDRAMALLRKVGMDGHAAVYPDKLSGGQKQRVAIARALAMGPRVLLCDEITAALDPETKSDVLGVLEEIRSDGLTIVMVTHEIGFARRAADRVALLADGQVAECGHAKEVIDNPGSSRAIKFLAKVMG